jgi:hypothetical protein
VAVAVVGRAEEWPRRLPCAGDVATAVGSYGCEILIVKVSVATKYPASETITQYWPL